MPRASIPRRVSTALINSLGAGVVPRVGLEYIAVGRKNEIAALLNDLENTSDGGACFRFVVGRYGSGKSFMLQLLRNYAMDRNFVVADADLSPDRRLAGGSNQGVATYRELMRNVSTKTRPDGGALAPVLERWISNIQATVVKDTGMRPSDTGFGDAVETKILDVITGMEGMVHGFDFAAVLSAYWRGYRLGEDNLRDAALRWFRGEFATKTEARQKLDVRVIIDDTSWYDYIKLMAKFVSEIGYTGLLILVDEAVNLYKITHRTARENNYEKLLSMFNDTMQGKAEYMSIVMAGTPQFLEDPRRGLYSYEALRSRLAESRFVRDGMISVSGPIIRLETLTYEEIFLLLQRLAEVHRAHYRHDHRLAPQELQAFMQEAVNRLGAEKLLTPREVIRDFIAVMDILHQNPRLTWQQVVHSPDFQPTPPSRDPHLEQGEGEFAEFQL